MLTADSRYAVSGSAGGKCSNDPAGVGFVLAGRRPVPGL